MSTVKPGFLMEAITLPLEKILPSRKLKADIKTSSRYQIIAASVREVGIIEPLVVYPQGGKSGHHLLLDGHVRLEVLRDLGHATTTCLVSTDDENCTYNERVSRIAPIQEIRMIQKAIDDGVSEERIAKALNVTPKTIRDSKSQLADISPDAIDLLKDKPVATMALRLFKKVKPYRQVEMAELMTTSGTYTASYAKLLLASTPRDQLVDAEKPDTRPEQMAKLESEMRAIEREFLTLEDTYSQDMLNLQLARGFLKALLGNGRVAKYVASKHGELLDQLQKVVEASSLEG